MLVALGLPQLWDRAGTAGKRMADGFCTLNLCGLGVPRGEAHLRSERHLSPGWPGSAALAECPLFVRT